MAPPKLRLGGSAHRIENLSNTKELPLPVSFAPVANSWDVDGWPVLLIEEPPIVTAAKPEAGARRLKLLHVARAVSQVTPHTVENLHRCVAGYCTKVSASLRGPHYGDPLRRWRLGHLPRPNSRRTSSYAVPSPRASEARARSSAR